MWPGRWAGAPGASLVADAAAALPFADGCFDAVVSMLTHTDFDHPQAAFAEAARVLRRGGRLSYVGVHHLPLADLVGAALGTGLTLMRLEEPGDDDHYPFLITLQLRR